MAEKKQSLVDPVYQKFAKGVVRAIGSTDFYEYFMDSIARAKNEIQFSNRKMIKTVDPVWVDNIEKALDAMQVIISSPRNVIKEEELIVNVANVKKSNAETVRHLAQHSAYIDNFDEAGGDVRPNKLMQKYREDSIELYENRLVYTALENAHRFVKIRHDALIEVMSDEFGAKLKLTSDMVSPTEAVHLDMFLHIKEIDSAMQTDEKNADIFTRISRLNRILSVFMNTPFAQQMKKFPPIKGAIHKTNVLKKNKNYKEVLALFEFLRQYDDIGYAVKIVEQNPVVSERFQRDIFHNVLFNYLVLKGYLEDEADRQLPQTAQKGRKRVLKPKFIHEIVEELTEDYDLPDVEIRKVLIEELTKEQLMQEEAAERRRLVEEQQQRKKEEEARLRAEKKAEAERIKAEKAAERERLRLEKEAEENRKRLERIELEQQDRRRADIYKKELEHFSENLQERIKKRSEANIKYDRERQRFEEAVRMAEDVEYRKKAEAEQAKKRATEEAERQRIAEEKRRQEIAAEKERLAREAAAEQRRRDLERIKPYVEELSRFRSGIQSGQRLRAELEESIRQEEQLRQRRKMERLKRK